MGHRSTLEDRYTVRCRANGHESIDPDKTPAQKYLKGNCSQCFVESRRELRDSLVPGAVVKVNGLNHKITDRCSSKNGDLLWLQNLEDPEEGTTWVELEEILDTL